MSDPAIPPDDEIPRSADSSVHRLVDRLRQQQAELQVQNAALRDIRSRLEQNRDRYRFLYDRAPVAFFSIDQRGLVMNCNLAAERLVCRVRDDLVGSPFAALIAESGIRDFFQRLASAFSHDRHLAMDLVLRKSDGAPVSVRLTGEVERIDQEDTGPILLLAAADISVHKALEVELVTARDAAEAASRAKSGFLATMSHELRTPLNGVIGMLDILGETELDHDQRTCVELAMTSGRALLTLINDILDLSRIEAGHIDLRPEPFVLRTMVEQASAVVAESAVAKGLKVVCHVPAGLPRRVVGDGDRLRQILVNLVGNAVKFTATGWVRVRVAQREPGRIRFSVSDSGPGIAADFLPQLFKPFSMGDASASRRHGGTGLGLAISRRLVDNLGGEITVDNHVGSPGCTFSFDVPLPAAAPSADDPVIDIFETLKVLVVSADPFEREALADALGESGIGVDLAADWAEAASLVDGMAEAPWDAVVADGALPGADQVLARFHAAPPLIRLGSASTDVVSDLPVVSRLMRPMQSRQILDILHRLQPSEEQKTPTSARVVRRRRTRILVVEDNPANQVVMRSALAALGYSCEMAEDGETAVKLVAAAAYDVVFMDCLMPGMDGYATTKAIRVRETAVGAAHTPIVALTARALRGDRDECIAAGMDDYLTKPVTRDAIDQAIRRWVGRKPDPVA